MTFIEHTHKASQQVNMLTQPGEFSGFKSFLKKTIEQPKLPWSGTGKKNRKTQVNTEELQVFLRIETNFFSNLFKFSLSAGEEKEKQIY